MSRHRNSLPTFSGREDPDTYFDWEQRMNNFFETVNYSEEKKVSIATAQLTKIASSWWENVLWINYSRTGVADTTWKQMKSQLRFHFIPMEYHQDLQSRFQRLSQGKRSVKNYYDKFKLLLGRLGWDVSEEFLLNHFLDGLQERIARKVVRLHYRRFEDLLRLAIQVEQQIEEKTTSSRKSKVQLEPSIAEEVTKEEVVIPENEPTLLLVSKEEEVIHQSKDNPPTGPHALEEPHSMEPLPVLPVIQVSSSIVGLEPVMLEHEETAISWWGKLFQEGEYDEVIASPIGLIRLPTGIETHPSQSRTIAVGKLPRPEFIPIEGSGWLQVPFDPGKLPFPSTI